ncbi:hypothetical protein HK405_007246, partial [Cladochytrium tenue]
MSNLKDISGMVAIVTGASSGFGRAITERLASRGARLVLADVSVAAGETLARELAARGVATIFVRCDVTSSRDLREVFRAAVEKFGRVDICINNAGIGETKSFVDDTEQLDWKKVVEIDLTAVIEGTQLALRQMRAQTGPAGGVVVNIA